VDENRAFAQLNEGETFEWVVPAEEAASRLDAFLARRLAAFSRRERAELIADKHTLINGRPVSKGTRVQKGDYIVVSPPFAPPTPSFSLIQINYCDDCLILIIKPAGLPSIGLRHAQTQTVAHFLLDQFPETARAGSRRMEAGLAHRLDTDTSGLLLAARTPSAYRDLRKQFHDRSVEKHYLALVEGSIKDQGQIAHPLEPTGPRGNRMRIARSNRGQEALTHYVPVKHFPRHTLMRITIITGVRHQIRAHFAALDHPIVGDKLYGANNQSAARLCLHAETLTFQHPKTGKKLHHTSSLPRDFCAELKRIDSELG